MTDELTREQLVFQNVMKELFDEIEQCPAVGVLFEADNGDCMLCTAKYPLYSGKCSGFTLAKDKQDYINNLKEIKMSEKTEKTVKTESRPKMLVRIVKDNNLSIDDAVLHPELVVKYANHKSWIKKDYISLKAKGKF